MGSWDPHDPETVGKPQCLGKGGWNEESLLTHCYRQEIESQRASGLTQGSHSEEGLGLGAGTVHRHPSVSSNPARKWNHALNFCRKPLEQKRFYLTVSQTQVLQVQGQVLICISPSHPPASPREQVQRLFHFTNGETEALGHSLM